MPTETDILRYAAFAAEEGGGNPAGIVLDASALDEAAMQRIAADVGYAETAFITGQDPDSSRRVSIRYFSPDAEVPFCGHATVATAVALAEREGDGPFTFDTAVGPIVISTLASDEGVTASFTSVEPALVELGAGVARRLLEILGLTEDDLDERYPFGGAFAGNVHPIAVVRDRATFDSFAFDGPTLRALMDSEGWKGTVCILHPLPSGSSARPAFEARNLFPVGDLLEDPATGSAAASVGGYLRLTGLVVPPVRVEIRQGAHVGRPSLLEVDVPVAGGIVVRGSARPIA